jgi:starvation-inducible DNA-binding protein
MTKTAAQIIREQMDSIGATMVPIPNISMVQGTVSNVPIETPKLASAVVPPQFSTQAIYDLSEQLNPLLADVFAIYLKTKNFHWHMNGAHFRDYHLMLDEHGDQIYSIADDLAERVRKIGGTTLRSIGDIARRQRIVDNDANSVAPDEMLAELRDDNLRLVTFMLTAHKVCEHYDDVATASLLEVWIDEAQRRAWFLGETVGDDPQVDHINDPFSSFNKLQ